MLDEPMTYDDGFETCDDFESDILTVYDFEQIKGLDKEMFKGLIFLLYFCSTTLSFFVAIKVSLLCLSL